MGSSPLLPDTFLCPYLLNSPGAPQATSGRCSPPTPCPTRAVHRGLIVFAVCPLCFLPIPITCCSHVCSPLNYDKRVLSFISVSKPVSCQPTHHKVARDILLPMRSDHLFPIVSREAAQGLVDGRLNGCRMSERPASLGESRGVL